MRIFGALLVLVGLLNAAIPAKACSCIGQQTMKEAVKQADVVFVGTMLFKKLVNLSDPISSMPVSGETAGPGTGNDNRTVACYLFLVHTVCKGHITKGIITVFTGLGGGDCGVRFEIGRKYMVFGTKESYLGAQYDKTKYPETDNIFWTNSCTRTTDYNPNEFSELKKYSGRLKGSPEVTTTVIDTAKTDVDFTAKINRTDATNDGVFLNGYVVSIPSAELIKMNGKTVEVSGLVTVVKTADAVVEDNMVQERNVEIKYILNPHIIIVD